MRSFLALAPTSATARTLKGLGCLYRETALGGVAAVPQGTTIPEETTLDFTVTVLDPAFYGYTALTLRPRKIYECYYPPEKKVYRYKEGVPVLSNLTGAGRGNTRFLSREFPALAPDDLAEALYVAGNALMQLTGDQPGATTQQIHVSAATAPVFVHQGDVPALVPPEGLAGAPAGGVLLEDGIPDQVFALIRLSAARNGDASFVDAAGQARSPAQVFEVRFKNRSTTWQYFNKSTGNFISAEGASIPLTYFGNTGSKQKPSEGLISVLKTGDQVTKLVSKIFV